MVGSGYQAPEDPVSPCSGQEHSHKQNIFKREEGDGESREQGGREGRNRGAKEDGLTMKSHTWVSSFGTPWQTRNSKHGQQVWLPPAEKPQPPIPTRAQVLSQVVGGQA